MQIDGLWGLLVAGLAIVVSLYAMLRGGKEFGEGVSRTISDIELAAAAAREWVLAAQQLYETGKLDREQRFEWVLFRLQATFPELTEDTLAGGIEAAVQWMKVLSGHAKNASNRSSAG